MLVDESIDTTSQMKWDEGENGKPRQNMYHKGEANILRNARKHYKLIMSICLNIVP